MGVILGSWAIRYAVSFVATPFPLLAGASISSASKP
jgi:hypothetical protein